MTLLPVDFWESERDRLLAVLLPRIETLAAAGSDLALDRLARVGITVDNTLAQENAARWAEEHTDRLLQELGTVTEDGVGTILSEWIETPGATRGDLEELLRPFLDGNETRGENVAVSEITRSMYQGELVTYEAAGIPLPPMFDQGVGQMRFGPPLHPRGRCWPRIEQLSNGDLVVVWTTNRDDLVCKEPFPTPWGTVQGCRDMHNRIISAGPYSGKKLSEVRA